MKKFSSAVLMLLAAIITFGCGSSQKNPTQPTERPSVETSSPLAKLLLEDNLSVLVTGITSPGPIRLQAIIAKDGVADTIASRDFTASETTKRLSFRYPISFSELTNDGIVSFDDFYVFADCFGGSQVSKFDLNLDNKVDMDDFFELQSYLDAQPVQFSQKYDLNSDDSVNMDDFFLLVDHLNKPENIEYDPAADINKDGIVDLNDFFLFADDFGVSVRDSTSTRQYSLRVSSLGGSFIPVQVRMTSDLLLTRHNIDINVAGNNAPFVTWHDQLPDTTPTHMTAGGNFYFHVEATGRVKPPMTITINGKTVERNMSEKPQAPGTFWAWGQLDGWPSNPTASRRNLLVTVVVTDSSGFVTTVERTVVQDSSAIAAKSPVLSLSRTSLGFGNVAIGVPSTATLTVANTGDTTLTGTISVSGAGFVTSATNVSVAAKSTQLVNVTFTPALVTNYTGTIAVVTNGGSGNVSLVGSGINAATPVMAVSPMIVNFDSVLVGEWASRSVTIQNTGTDNLAITGITSSAAQMTVSPSTGTIIPGSSMGVTIIYTPTTTGTTNCNLVVNSNAGSITIAATGIGKAPAVPEEPAPIITLAQARVRGVDYSAGGGFSAMIGEPILLSMRAIGTTPLPQVEWQYSLNGGSSWTHIADGDTSSFSFTGFSSRAKVRGVARNPNDLSKERIAIWNVQILANAP